MPRPLDAARWPGFSSNLLYWILDRDDPAFLEEGFAAARLERRIATRA